MSKFILCFALIINVLLFPGCLENAFTGPLEFENPHILRVMMRNSSQGPFSVNDRPSTSVGELDFVRAHFSDARIEPSYSFDIKRQSVPLARVFYLVLRLPATTADEPGDLIIIVTEPSAGVFDASTSDTLWIRVISVEDL